MPPKKTIIKENIKENVKDENIKEEQIIKKSPKSKTIEKKISKSPKKEKDEDKDNLSGWAISKQDQKKYNNEYLQSVKSLSYESDVMIDKKQESELWVDIYAPKSLYEYIDDNKNIEIALNWLENFRKKVKKTPAILLLTGKPGIGKTTLAHLIFKSLNYDYHEFNASEARTGKELKEYLEIFNKGNILNFFDGCANMKKGLIMDEVDGIDSRGIANDGLTIFLNMSYANKPEKFKYPIICIANDSTCNKVDKIRKYSLEIEVKQPSKENLKKFLERIIEGEKIDIEKKVINELINDSEADFRQVANKLSYLCKLIIKDKDSKDTKTGKKKITLKQFQEISKLTMNDKKFEIDEIIHKIMLEETLLKETLRLYETDVNIITMSFYSNFTENITKLNVSNKDKIKTLSQISDCLVDGEIYSDFYWKTKIGSLENYQCISHLVYPKCLMNELAKKTPSKKANWNFTGKRIFYLNPHIMDRFMKISISLQIYSNSHLSYLVELIWNLIKSNQFIEQEKLYKKILIKLFDAGIEPKDFENLYKGFTQDLEETKANEEVYKKLKVILKKHFTEYETLHLKEFQANLELIPSQLDGFLSI